MLASLQHLTTSCMRRVLLVMPILKCNHAQADTAREVAAEMVENLSLDEREAEFIADLIQVGAHAPPDATSKGWFN